MSLLGSLLIDKEAMIRVGDIITIQDFYLPKHQQIFEAILELFRKHEPIDILSLSNRLSEKNQLEEIGGRAYLIQLSNSVPTSSHVVNYANIIQKKIHIAQIDTDRSRDYSLWF